MRNALLTATVTLGMAIALPAFAQLGSPTANTPLNTTNSVPNGQNSGSAVPSAPMTYRSQANGRNSGRANPTGTDISSTPGTTPVGTGMSGPASDHASNIAGTSAGSTIAPHLPAPSVAANASPQQLLAAAQQAIRQHRTGAAQEALERAETRLLDRSTDASGASADPMVQQVSGARMALGKGDTAGANRMISTALGLK